MAKTTRWELPYPETSDAADVPKWMKEMATSLDGVAMDDQGALGSRPAAGKKGRYYYATDAEALYRDTGAAWVRVGAFKTGLVQASGELSNKGSITDIPGASITLEPAVKSLIIVRAQFQLKATHTREASSYKNDTASGDIYIDGGTSNQIFHEVTFERTSPTTGDKVSSTSVLPHVYQKEVEAGSRVVKLRFIGGGSVFSSSTKFFYEMRPV